MRFDLHGGKEHSVERDNPSSQEWVDFRFRQTQPQAPSVSLQLRDRAIAEFDRETMNESREAKVDWSTHLLNAEALVEGGECDLALTLIEEFCSPNLITFRHFYLCKRALWEWLPKWQDLGLKRSCGLRPTFESYALTGHFYYQLGNDSRAEGFYHTALTRLAADHPELFEVLKIWAISPCAVATLMRLKTFTIKHSL